MIEIELGGKKRKFSFGLDMLGWVQKDSGLDITETSDMPSNALFFILIKPIIYRGNERELKKEGSKPDYTYDEVENWIKDKGMYHEDIMSLWGAFNETIVDLTPKTSKKLKGEKKS
ncbi:MAG: hypothetical protein AAF600_10935 [Bacteroidota bacterium]